MGKVFEKICLQYYEQRLKNGIVPFLPTDCGNWWGTDPRRKQPSEIDILAHTRGAMLFIECKWRNEKVQQKILTDLIEKAKMFTAEQKFYWLISLSGFRDFTVKNNVELIDLDDVYAV